LGSRTYLESAFLVLLRLLTCVRSPILSMLFFCVCVCVLLGLLAGAVPTSSTGRVQSSTTSPLLISCIPLPRSSSSRASVVVLMSSCGCRSRGWHSNVTFVSSHISCPQSIESSTPCLLSTHGAFASFRTSLPPTAPRSSSSLCSGAAPVEGVLSVCIASPSSARRSSP